MKFGRMPRRQPGSGRSPRPTRGMAAGAGNRLRTTANETRVSWLSSGGGPGQRVAGHYPGYVPNLFDSVRAKSGVLTRPGGAALHVVVVRASRQLFLEENHG